MSDKGIKLHPRHVIRNKAKSKFGYAFVHIAEEYELTMGEMLVMISDLLNSWCYKFQNLVDSE